MPLIACLGWGSLIWDPRDLPVQRKWFDDGPIISVEFLRQSMDGRMTLVLHEKGTLSRALWALFDTEDLQDAKAALGARERCKPDDIAAWSRGESAPKHILGIADWAEAHGIDSVVWTALSPKFSGVEKVPTLDEVIEYLSRLTGAERDNAERYIRFAPRQIDTAYRRRIEASLHWTAATRRARGSFDHGCE